MVDEIKGLFREDPLGAGGIEQNPQPLDQNEYDAIRYSPSPDATNFFITEQYFENRKGRDRFNFVSSGSLASSPHLDVARVVGYRLIITKIKIFRRLAGVGGDTKIDINKYDTTTATYKSLWNDSSNQPSINFSTGDNYIHSVPGDSPLPDQLILLEDDILSIELDTVETGAPKDLVVEIFGDIVIV